MHTVETITHADDNRVPDGERVRIVIDDDPMPPGGDALAPAWRVERARYDAPRVELASDYDPPDLDTGTIAAAIRHYGPFAAVPTTRVRDMVTRYLQIWHGVTTVQWVTDDRGDVAFIIADTPAWRAHVGCDDTPANIDGDVAEWKAYVDGDVYGVIRERSVSGETRWEDGTVTPVHEWRQTDSTWGYYGLDSARSEL